jgi:ribosomal protein S18 acetylase RimI-like enzyme
MPVVRRGTTADVEDLLRLRAVLFAALGVELERAYWESACRQVLLDGLSSGDLAAAVAETEDGTVVACGIAAIRRWLPSPRNASGLMGYIGSMATDEGWRRQGLGRQVVECLVEVLQGRGVTEIELHATESSEGLLSAAGFVDRVGRGALRLPGDDDDAPGPSAHI